MRVPCVLIPKLRLLFKKHTVSRLVVVHPESVQYIQYDPSTTEFCVRYVTGQEVCITDKENPDNTKKMFDSLTNLISGTH